MTAKSEHLTTTLCCWVVLVLSIFLACTTKAFAPRLCRHLHHHHHRHRHPPSSAAQWTSIFPDTTTAGYTAVDAAAANNNNNYNVDDNIAVGPRMDINENFPGLHKVHTNPDIFIIRNFLPPHCCDDLIHRAVQSGRLIRSPVAYAGWTTDFRDLFELAAKGPVAWIALVTAWWQVGHSDTNNNNNNNNDIIMINADAEGAAAAATATTTQQQQVDLVLHALQNYGVVLVLTTALIAAFTWSRTESLKGMRTSTSTTLDQLTNDPARRKMDGTTQFVEQTAKLFGSSKDGDNNNNNNNPHAHLREEASYFEAPTVIRYEAGQVLAPHYDANRSADMEDANRGGQTLATLIVYLNDVSKGGLTRFGKLSAAPTTVSTTTDSDKNDTDDDDDEDRLVIRPKQGDALLFFPADKYGMFDPRTEHEGMSAIDEKWIARIWRHKSRVPPPFGLDESNLSQLL